MNNCPESQTDFDGGVSESKSLTEKPGKLSQKAYGVLSAVPAIAFTLFAVLMIVCAALLQVATVKAFGLSEKFGTIFNGARFDEISGLNGLSVAQLIFSLVTVIYAAVLLIHKFSSMKYRKLLGKPLYRTLEIVSAAFVLVQLIFAVAIIGRVNAADGGMGVITVGAYPVFAIILSVACLLAVVIATVACCVQEKACPEILESWNEERKNARAGAKASAANKVAKFSGMKIAKLIVPLVVVVAIVGFMSASNLVARFEKKPFDADALKQTITADAGKFEVSKYTVEGIIGNPYLPEGATADAQNSVYYTENYLDLLSKIQRNQKYALLAIEQADSRISGLLKQAKELELEQETLAYGRLDIVYTESGYIKAIVYNNVVIDGFPTVAKKLDKVEVFRVNEKYLDQSDTLRRVDKVAYFATYTDGSFVYGTTEYAAVLTDDGTPVAVYEGSCEGKTLVWEDAFGKYEVVATAVNG